MNKEVDIRNEEILLLGLCRLDFGPELKVMLMALAEGQIDWKYFTSLANSHGVAALIYNNLVKLKFIQYVPIEERDFLWNALTMSISRNAFNTQTISGVLELLNKESIKSVILKGLALEHTVYGNAGLRQMSDVDILINKKDCLRARDILLDSGFESLPVKSVFHKSIIIYTGKHLPSLIKNGSSVEIHHELFGGKENVLTKMLFETSYEVIIGGKKAFIPQPQIFFLYLVKHLYLHEMNNESQLRLYTDLVVLIEKHRNVIINENLLTLAADAGMSEILAWRLEPLRDLWGITFAEWLNDFINKWYNPDSINKFIFFLKSPKDNPTSDRPANYSRQVKEIKGLHRKVLFVVGDMFPTLTFMKKRYGCRTGWQALKYYPHRLGKLFWLFK